jgi:hypothetical protein
MLYAEADMFDPGINNKAVPVSSGYVNMGYDPGHYNVRLSRLDQSHVSFRDTYLRDTRHAHLGYRNGSAIISNTSQEIKPDYRDLWVLSYPGFQVAETRLHIFV